MTIQTFSRRLRVPLSPEELFRWHARPGAFDRLSPPWEAVRREGRDPGLREGDRVVLRVPLGPLRTTWIAEIREVAPGRGFRDVQVRGPFRVWDHRHRMRPSEGGAELEDLVEYALPGGPVGRWLGGPHVRRQLDRLFTHRHRITLEDARDLIAAQQKGVASMNVVVTGSSGLVGSTLVPKLETAGHTVVRAIRSGTPEPGREVSWDRERGLVEAQALPPIHAVVHLAGENIAGRWTEARKREIRESRIEGTRAVARSLAALEQRPEVLVCASAIGVYGDRADELVDERSAAGTGFLADVVREWEDAARPAIDAGIRVVFARFGVVLSPRGGALPKMLPPFKLGIGGRIGSGEQYMSWVSVEDAARAIEHAMTTPTLTGPMNVVAPEAVRNREFTRTLGRVLGRPTVFPLPAFAARLLLGEMADELLLASTRVRPGVLAESGFTFRHPDLEGALRALLGRTKATPASGSDAA